MRSARAAGRNVLVVQVQDRAGRTAQAQRVVFFQPGPTITITAPPPLTAFNRTSIAVSGTVGADAVAVYCNEAVAGLSNDGFGATVTLKEGPNTITCVAQNAAGQVGTASTTVMLDTQPPRVTIQTPRTNAVLTTSPVTVSGIINDVVVGTVNVEEARVECNGVQAQIANRAFVALAVPLTSGANPITCTGIDRAGNVDTDRIDVTFTATAAAKITIVSGNNQSAPIGTLLPEPLVVALTENGVPAVGKRVQFTIRRNDGSLSTGSDNKRSLIVTTDANGRAEIRLTLGTWAGAGSNQVEAIATGFVGETLFTASATPGPPGLIVVDAGNNQEGVIGQSLPRPFIAAVVDQGKNRLAGVPVTFRVREGSGNFSGLSEVTVVTDSDGRAETVLALGPEEGIDNNVVKASFPGNTGASATFIASGRLAGDPAQTRISGVVLDNSNNPIVGVTLRVKGTGLTTQSDAQGQFVVQPAPVGHVVLFVDGSTVVPRNGWPWPNLEFELVTIAGHDNTVGMPIYLLPIDTPRGVVVDETHGGTLTLEEIPGFALTIAPGSVTFPDGNRRGTISVTAVHADKVPMIPSFGRQPRFIVTIQPPGTHFNPPAPITFPNVDGLAPGQISEVFSFDHDLGQFVSIGTGSVSEDGLVIRSDPGVGILKGGWHEGGGGPDDPGDGEPVTVKFEDEEELALVVGEEKEIVAIGKPGPGEAPGITWRSEDEEVLTVEKVSEETIDQDGEQVVKSVAKAVGGKPGKKKAKVKYGKGTDPNKAKEIDKEISVFNPRVKLEIIPVNGKHTIINPNNHFSEDTKLKATVIYPPEDATKAGRVVENFKGKIVFKEMEGTHYYPQFLFSGEVGVTVGRELVCNPNGQNCVEVLDENLKGSVIITVRSFATVPESELQVGTNAGVKPRPARIQATARATGTQEDQTLDQGTNPVEIHQWVDEDVPGGFIDWLHDYATAVLGDWQSGRLSGEAEVLTAVGLVNTIRQIPVEVVIDSTGKKATTCGTGIRGRISVSPICGVAMNFFRDPESDDKEMQDTIIHEARHIWQDDQSQRDDPGDARLHDDIPAGQPIPGTNFRQGPLNDEDFDGYLDDVQFSSGTALLLLESQWGFQDNHRDPGGGPPYAGPGPLRECANKWEEDAYNFAYRLTGNGSRPRACR